MYERKINKKTLLYLGIILIIILLISVGIFFYFFSKKPALKPIQIKPTTAEEALTKAINTPAQNTIKLSNTEQEKIQKNINTPAKNKASTKISEENLLKIINTPAQK